ncbi:SGNH/GDSL hydrolase family protein [Pseudarthrobacter sp. So.54]
MVAPMIAVGILAAGCGQTPSAPTPDAGASQRGGVPAAVASRAPGEPVALGSNGKAKFFPLPGPAGAPAGPLTPPLLPANLPANLPVNLPAGSIYRNPASGRDEVVVADIARTAVLIGDSQSEPVTSWPRTALASLGYTVHFCGLGGTGYVAANGKTGNYIDALERGDWLLPYGSPPLVVLEGGGNDAARGATDQQISANAERLIAGVRGRYPEARLAMVGTLARGAANGGGRRTQVDALLGTVAARHSIPFVSVGDWLTRYNLTKSMADGVHMNADGHAALAVLLAQRLAEFTLQAPPPDSLRP